MIDTLQVIDRHLDHLDRGADAILAAVTEATTPCDHSHGQTFRSGDWTCKRCHQPTGVSLEMMLARSSWYSTLANGNRIISVAVVDLMELVEEHISHLQHVLKTDPTPIPTLGPELATHQTLFAALAAYTAEVAA